MNKQWLWNLLTIVLLVVGLGVWIWLPWQGVLGVAVALALWLFLTRSGRLALAATGIGIASLPQRWGASSVIVVGIAGVVAVLVAMLSMGRGFQSTMNSTGDETTAIVLRGGSQAETNSVIMRDQVPLISSLPGIARDGEGAQKLMTIAITGAVPVGYVYVDGSSVGETDEDLLKDRRILRDEAGQALENRQEQQMEQKVRDALKAKLSAEELEQVRIELQTQVEGPALMVVGFAPLVALMLSVKFGLAASGVYLLSGAVATMVALYVNKELAARDR